MAVGGGVCVCVCMCLSPTKCKIYGIHSHNGLPTSLLANDLCFFDKCVSPVNICHFKVCIETTTHTHTHEQKKNGKGECKMQRKTRSKRARSQQEGSEGKMRT